MTNQIQEILIYKGKEYQPFDAPLETFRMLGGRIPKFDVPSTMLWRGYVGKWAIVDDRLYLVELEGTIKKKLKISLSDLFPQFPERVFAHWVNGEMRLPIGKEIANQYMGAETIYEHDLFLYFTNGIVVGSDLINNNAPVHPSNSINYPIPNRTQKGIKFSVELGDLLSRYEVEDVETIETVRDPLCAVPNVPFGHLNPAWMVFRDKISDGDEVWSFYTEWHRPWLNEIVSGYAIKRGEIVSSYWITSQFRTN